MSAGRNSSRTRMSPPSQCLPTTRARAGGAVRAAGGQGGGVLRGVQGGADVVAHPAVDRDVEPARAAVQLHRLDRADPVEREGARTADRPAGLDRQVRHRDAQRGALGVDDPPQGPGQRLGRRRGVGAGVGDAEAAAEVELGQLDAGLRSANSACSRSVRRAATSKPSASKICDPMWEWMPTRSSAGWSWQARSACGGRCRRRSRSRTSGPRGRWRCTRGCAPRRRW